MNNKPYKKYTLDDGTVITAPELAEKVGITIKNARTRLSINTDPEKVFKPKKIKNGDNPESYKMRMILSRGMFDEMYVLAFKTI
jgi:hypothetical protein